MFEPVASFATLCCLCDERIDAARPPGIRAARADARQQAWAGDIELAPCLARDQPRPRFEALAQRGVLPHHAPIAAACLLPRAVIRKMLCTKHKTITVSPGASAAARAGRRCRPAAKVFTKMGVVIARLDL